jgi:ABC-type sugar transport systems, permease components
MQNQVSALSTIHIKRKKRMNIASVVLLIIGAIITLIGVYGYMMGDLQVGALQPLATQVYEARAVAQNAAMPVVGSITLFGNFTIPMALMSTIMNTAVILILFGGMLIYNGIMFRIQTLEQMKDLFFVEPAIFIFLLFVYYPVIDLVRISFTDMRMLSDASFTFAGLKNYTWLFQGSGFRYFTESLAITATYTFWELVITLAGGMLLALLLGRMTKTFNAMRAIVFLPKYISVSVSAVVFIWILNGRFGILNSLLANFGIQGPDWLSQASTALTGVLFLTAWRVVGYAMMIYLSAMRGIPQDYYEAASIDGADAVHQFRFITLPLLAPTTLFLFVTTFIASMKVFQSVDVMTEGGPGKATNVMVYWIYDLSFKDFRVARASAVSVVFFVILLICTAATMRYSNRSVNYDA